MPVTSLHLSPNSFCLYILQGSIPFLVLMKRKLNVFGWIWITFSKTRATRNYLFKIVFIVMKQEEMHDQPQCSYRRNCFTLTMDFKTTYTTAGCDAFVQYNRPNEDMNTRHRQYLEKTFSCNSQAHLIFQSRCDKRTDPKTYKCTMWAKAILPVKAGYTALAQRKNLGEAWRRFSTWLEKM